MLTFKVTTVGASSGVILTKEAMARLRVKKGDTLFLTEAPDGGYRLTPYDPEFRTPDGARRRDHARRPRGASSAGNQVSSETSGPWRWVDAQIVLAIHDHQLAEHGGADGIRDIGAIESASARPANLAAYGNPDAAELATAYIWGLAKNHGFIDGNKRTGLGYGARLPGRQWSRLGLRSRGCNPSHGRRRS